MRHPKFLGNDIVHWSGPDAREKRPDSVQSRRFLDRILSSTEYTEHDRLMSLCLGHGSGRHGSDRHAADRHGSDPDDSPTIAAEALRGSDEAAVWSRALWALWAAKEATFKAAAKAVPHLAFSPRSIVVTVDPNTQRLGEAGLVGGTADARIDRPQPLARGRAVVGRQWYEIVWEACGEFVHTVSIGPFHSAQASQSDPDADSEAGCCLWDGIIHASALHDSVLSGIAGASQSLRNAGERASEAVRRLACNLGRTVPGLRTAALEVRRVAGFGTRIGAPAFFESGHGRRLSNLDISLSHDGPWSAAALLNRTPDSAQTAEDDWNAYDGRRDED